MMTPFLISFFACFYAVGLFRVTEMIIDSDIPFFALFGQRKYYLLSFVHAWIRSQELSDLNEDEIVDKLKRHVFPFELYPGSYKEIEIVRAIIQQKYLVKKYLLHNECKKSTFVQLLEEYQETSSMVTQNQEAILLLRNILTPQYKNKTEEMIHIFGHLLSPAFNLKSLSNKISPGEKESYVFSTAIACRVINEKCSMQAFVDCMLAIKRVHPEMKIVSNKQSISYHLNKTLKKVIIDELGPRLTAS